MLTKFAIYRALFLRYFADISEIYISLGLPSHENHNSAKIRHNDILLRLKRDFAPAKNRRNDISQGELRFRFVIFVQLYPINLFTYFAQD